MPKGCLSFMQDKAGKLAHEIKYKQQAANGDVTHPVFVYLSRGHSGRPGGLCTPCSHLFAPGWGRAVRCYRASALCGGHGLVLRAGRAWHSRSKSSSRSQHSPELDVGTHIVVERLLLDILRGSKQSNCSATHEMLALH